MKSSNIPTTLTLAACVAMACAGTASAAEDSGWYLGGNVGQARAKIDDARITDSLLGAGFATSAIRDDKDHFGYKAFAGYDFNRYFALEGGYFDPGRFGYLASTTPAGTLSGNMRLNGVNLDALAFLPFTGNFSAFGRAGLNHAKARDSFVGSGAVNVLTPDRNHSATNYTLGLGLQYRFSRALAGRIEVERFRISDPVGPKGDVDLYSVGLVYKLGRHAPAPVAAVPPPPPPPAPRPVAPMPVVEAAPPPPPPPPVFVAAPVRTQRYCSILDLHFDINKAEIQRESRERLAIAGTFLKKYPKNTAVIEGYTDDVGTDAANLKLSQNRANGVVRYLIDNFQIAPAQLTAVGYGEANPVADNRTQEGKRENRRIEAVIECATDVAGLEVKSARVTMALLIEFDQNSADVRPQYRNDLAEVADFLKANPAVTATVEGHTGNLQATPELALEISQRRAQNVVNYLVENFGIARTRLAAAGFGRTRPAAYNTTLEGQQENRRVNIIINYPR
jgi:OOP family OmpA-OmpF porin